MQAQKFGGVGVGLCVLVWLVWVGVDGGTLVCLKKSQIGRVGEGPAACAKTKVL